MAAVLGALGPLTAEASPGDPLIAAPPSTTLFEPREVGARVWGEVSDGRLFYDLGVFDGPIGTRGADELSVVSQLTVVPVEPLTVWGGYRVWPTAAGTEGLQPIEVFRLITFFEPAQELEASGPRHQVSTGPIVRFDVHF